MLRFRSTTLPWVATLFFVLPSAATADFRYDDFRRTDAVQLVPSATVVERRLRLTPAVAWRKGAVWHSEPVLVHAGFETTFQFQITGRGGTGNGADGFAFVIQNFDPSALSEMGGSLGYGQPGFKNSLAIEFDTYYNSEYNDPDNMHVSVHTGGTAPNSENENYSLGRISGVSALRDAAVHTARIRYVPGSLQVYLDDMGTPLLNVPCSFYRIQTSFANKLGLNLGRAWVGITATTGAGYENHDLLSWSFRSDLERNPVSKSANLHVHSNISNKRWGWPDHWAFIGPPSEVLEDAAEEGLNIVGFSDHGESINVNADPGSWPEKLGASYDEWRWLGIVSRPGGPIALRGFEWTPNPGDTSDQHVNVFGSNDFCDVGRKVRGDPKEVLNWAALAEWLATPTRSGWTDELPPVAQFNHLWYGDRMLDFVWPPGEYDERLRNIFCLAELSTYGLGGYHDLGESERHWRSALQKGWHVAPSIGVDNYGPIEGFGLIMSAAVRRHTGVWMRDTYDGPESDAVLDALRARRVYATEDRDFQLKFQFRRVGETTWHWMGETLDVWAGDTLELNIDARGATGGRKIRKVFLMNVEGKIVQPYLNLTRGASTTFTLSPTLSMANLVDVPETVLEEKCLYLKVILDDVFGDVNILSAPIWLKQHTSQRTTIRTYDAYGVAGRSFLLSARLTNQIGAGVSDKRITLTLDDQPLDTAITGSDGTVQKSISLPSDLSLGEHRLKAEFAGDASAEPAWDVAILQSSIDATPITVNGPAVAGSIAAANGANWFRFTLVDPAPITLETTSGALTDSYLYLYGPDSPARFIVEDDDSGEGAMSHIERTLEPGTYFIKVRGYDSGDIGSYTIRATSGLQITPLTVNAPPAASSIAVSGDERWFSFVLSATGPCTINTTAGSLTDSYMYLYGPNSITFLLEDDDDDGDGAMARVTRRLGPGKYFVRIRDYGSGTGTFGIAVSAAAPGLATHLAFRTQPGQVNPAYVREPLNAQPVVEARDGNDAVATKFSGSASITVTGGPIGARLLGTTSVAFVNGIATFNGLSMDRSGSGYQMTASTATLDPVASTAFNVIGYRFQISDIAESLRWAAGFRSVPASVLVRYDTVATGGSAGRIDFADVTRIARKATGLEANP